MSAKTKSSPLLVQAAQCLPGQHPTAQEETRWRLLRSATEVFAEVGYHAATTREICRRAEVNLASIHYYYGDKAELYREVFRLTFLNECNTFNTLDIEHVSLENGLRAFFQCFFPVGTEEAPKLQLFMRLHAREVVEPSGVLDDAMMRTLLPSLGKLQTMLCREFGLEKPDTELDCMTIALTCLATFYFHNRMELDNFAPKLIEGQRAREMMTERLVGYAIGLVESERKRRSLAHLAYIT
ncbi:MAG: TetR/AcrR family transcriptional regulator [Gammaproteobacteria bacterium]|jgi:AcrR family transcriptional regulator|nr:TetR/AcrR family transcriptional regulator [Sideroxydans sp.]MBU4046703.1 TetR/AcrR family transcriptional regulator [Gammaproteobacteria bacterium]MBU4150700.1 TetR/AcrR family transcriptional regulator [Gammaproteobacteria bacterium]